MVGDGRGEEKVHREVNEMEMEQREGSQRVLKEQEESRDQEKKKQSFPSL